MYGNFQFIFLFSCASRKLKCKRPFYSLLIRCHTVFDSNCFHHSLSILPSVYEGSDKRHPVHAHSYESEVTSLMIFVGDTDRFSDILCVRVGYVVASMRNSSGFMRMYC